MTECREFRFKSPSSILVAGPSSSGKSVFVQKVIQEKNSLFERQPFKVCYCYGAWQNKFHELMKQGVHFHEGLPERNLLNQWFKGHGGVLVMDDLMDEGGNDKRVLDIFTKDSHHNDITVLYLCQDVFPIGKYAKTISRNAHYVVAFKNPRDQLGVRNLVLQAFPSEWEEVLKVYREATHKPYGYLLLDLHPSSDDNERLKSNLLKEEGFTTVYKKRDE